MHFIPASFILTAVAVKVLLKTHIDSQRCLFNRADLAIPDCVYFVNNLLLRKISIPNGNTVELKCENVWSAHKCQNGAFDRPIQQCNKRLKPDIITSQYVWPEASCPAPAIMYTVGFRSPNSVFSPLYYACYLKNEVRPIFVGHTVQKLPASISSRVQQDFTLDGIISGSDAATFRSDSIFNRFEVLLGKNQKYIASAMDNVIHRGHLAPAKDFVFSENKRSSFKYINVVPMFGAINMGSWFDLENWIRCWYRDVVLVTTFPYGILELPHSDNPQRMVKMFLGDGQKNPIPKWLVKNVNSEYLFLVYNNPFATERPDLPCTEKECPDSVTDLKDFATGYTSCCVPGSLLPRVSL